MQQFNYLLILAACALVTVPLELLGVRVYRQPKRLVATLAPILLAFGAWDAVAAERGAWWWSNEQILGARVLGLPVEELLFFIVIPLCALLTYEAFGQATHLASSARSLLNRRTGHKAEDTKVQR